MDDGNRPARGHRAAARPRRRCAVALGLILGLILGLVWPSAPAAAIGESVDGFPNWRERVIHQWINRARSDPQFEMDQCGASCAERACHVPLPPLPWALPLNRAARFHADAMVQQGFFAHDSPCTLVSNIDALYPASCNGAASCACAGSGTTAWWQRIQLFGGSPSGEIIASPADPNQAFYLWLYEHSTTSECSFTGANGHRWLILQASGSVGIGSSGRSVGNFGNGGTPAKIPSGSHYPQQAASVGVWANWYDTAAPSDASVNVEGTCSAMQLARGTGTNGAFHASIAGVGSGCHRYYFAFRDSNGTEVTYPSTGSLAIGSGVDCPDWDTLRPPACDATPTPTATGTPSASPSPSATATPTPSPTVAATATATETPSAPVAGTIRYRDGGSVIPAFSVALLHNGGVVHVETNVTGAYSAIAPIGPLTVAPQGEVADNAAIDGDDAAAILRAAVGLAEPSAAARLAGDASGNGLLSAWDAVLILRRASGATEPFPVAQACGTTTFFIPQGAPPAVGIAPHPASCERGRQTIDVGPAGASELNFEAVLIGDFAASWTP